MPPPEVWPLAGTAPVRSSSRHWTFDSKVREQPLTRRPLDASAPPTGGFTITSEMSGRLS